MKSTLLAGLAACLLSTPAMAALYTYQMDISLVEIEADGENTAITVADAVAILGADIGEDFSISFTLDTEKDSPFFIDEPGLNTAEMVTESIELVNPGTASWGVAPGIMAMQSAEGESSVLAYITDQLSLEQPVLTLNESYYAWTIQGSLDGTGVYNDPSLSFPTPTEIAQFAPAFGAVVLQKFTCDSALCDGNVGNWVSEYEIVASGISRMGPVSAPDSTVVPLPAGIVLLGGALAGLTALRRRG